MRRWCKLGLVTLLYLDKEKTVDVSVRYISRFQKDEMSLKEKQK